MNIKSVQKRVAKASKTSCKNQPKQASNPSPRNQNEMLLCMERATSIPEKLTEIEKQKNKTGFVLPVKQTNFSLNRGSAWQNLR